MKNWKNILLNVDGDRANLILNRPGLHNALNPELIGELTEAVEEISKTNEIRFVVFSGEGKSFCAGADINWFTSASQKTRMENWQEYLQFPELLKKIYRLPQITISAVHGNVQGGGNGLAAACDFVVAALSTVFAFGEVRLGVVPATIMPFIAKRVSIQNMKKLMYSGISVNATEASEIGLIDYIADDDKITGVIDKLISTLKPSAPNALQTCKQLLLKNETGEINIESSEYTASVLADLIHSKEGREGLTAFLDKRKPAWNNLKTEDNL